MFSVMQVVDQYGTKVSNSTRYKFYAWYDDKTMTHLRSEKWLEENRVQGIDNVKYWEPIILDVAE